MLGDSLLPRVRLIPSFLLGFDVLLLEFGVGPPMLSVPVSVSGFSEQLVPVADKRLYVDFTDLNRPEAPP